MNLLDLMFVGITWGATFKDSPANPDSPSEGASKIRETREAQLHLVVVH
jgi:hypothetical protein